MKNDFSAVILSAGFSSRMQDFKPLLKIDGIPVIGRLVKEFYQAGLREIIVVVGYRRSDIEKYLQTLPDEIYSAIKIKFNPVFEQGMYTSVQAGVAEVSCYKKGFFMLPVDYPLVQQTVFKRLMDFWLHEKQPENEIVYPVYNEKRGHPPLISTKLIPEIIIKEQEQGLRSFLYSHRSHAENVPINEEAILWDMDNQEDFKNIQEIYAKFNKQEFNKI